MDAAASSGNGGFGFGGQSANEGYAIPIEDALAIAKQIQSGNGSDTIHIGAHRRSSVSPSSPAPANARRLRRRADRRAERRAERERQRCRGLRRAVGLGRRVGRHPGRATPSSASTARPSPPAAQLTHTMVKYSPNDKVRVEWIDSSGQSHTATIELGSGSPA